MMVHCNVCNQSAKRISEPKDAPTGWQQMRTLNRMSRLSFLAYLVVVTDHAKLMLQHETE